MMYYDAKTKQVTAYDGRETAPAAANEFYLIRQNIYDPNSPAPVPSARRSGRSIGVPGVMRLLEQAQKSMANSSGTSFLVKRLVWLTMVSAFRAAWQMQLQAMQAI